MTQENKEPRKVLFVDDEERIRKMITQIAELTGIKDFEVFEDADSAVARIEGLDETTGGIVSDGLNGGWKDVVAAAREARLPAVVFSASTDIQKDVEAAGAIFLPKTADIADIQAMLLGLQNPDSD